MEDEEREQLLEKQHRHGQQIVTRAETPGRPSVSIYVANASVGTTSFGPRNLKYGVVQGCQELPQVPRVAGCCGIHMPETTWWFGGGCETTRASLGRSLREHYNS